MCNTKEICTKEICTVCDEVGYYNHNNDKKDNIILYDIYFVHRNCYDLAIEIIKNK